MAASPVLYVYYPPLNDDSYPGVPGRHITEADWASFTIAQRRTIENATTQEGWYRRKVWVHRDLVDETEEERAQREAAEAAARAEYDRKNSLVRYGQIEAMIDQLEVLPPAEEFATLRADVDAVADVPPRVEAVETKVARVDPGELAAYTGQSLAQGPQGPTWRRDAVSADWFSNINDAITAAGAGGTVLLSRDTTYDTGGSGDPVLLYDGLTIEGEDRSTSKISATGAAAMQTATPGTQVRHVAVRNLTVDGMGQAAVGVDARFVTRCQFERINVINVTEKGVWFGGDSIDAVGGWSNTLAHSDVHAPAVGAAVYFDGRWGASGPANANNNTVERCALFSKDGEDSFAVLILAGENNQFIANDMGYGNATAIRLSGSMAQHNRFLANRTENTNRAVLVEGGSRYNTFLANHFHARSSASPHHLVETVDGAYRNMFLANTVNQGGTLLPVYYDDAMENATTIMRPEAIWSIPVGALQFTNIYRSIESRTPTDSQPRFYLQGDGRMVWGDGTSTPDISVRRVVGNPEGVESARPGSLAMSTDGNLYRKATGTGATGWKALADKA